MTYRLNPEIRKIISPVTVVWNGQCGNSEKALTDCGDNMVFEFDNGNSACDYNFGRHFNVLSYEALDGRMVICVYEFMEPAKK